MLVNLDNVSFSYGDRTIFHDVNVTIGDRDRIGLIGVNGVGKSTFLNVLIGELTDYDGTINKKNGINIGYLRQNGALDSTNTVYEEMRGVFGDLLMIEDKMHVLEQDMSHYEVETEGYKRCMSEYTRLSNIFTTRCGYEIDVRIRTVLYGMGFGECMDGHRTFRFG